MANFGEPRIFHKDSISVSPVSRAVVRLRPLRLDTSSNEIASSCASGFLWNADGRLLLVSNWHVVTGVNPNTNDFLGKFCPNGMEISFFAERPAPNEENQNQHEMGHFRTTVSWDDCEPERTWLFHPSGQKTDIAMLSLSWDHEEWSPVCLNLTGIDLRFDGEVGEDVYIVGFPEGHSFERRLPMWKRGSIATDPALDQLGERQFYVDTIGNSGLSGSPVLLKKEMSLISGPDGRVRNRYAFAGIYAGRLGSSGLGGRVGRVFKSDVVFELIDEIITQNAV